MIKKRNEIPIKKYTPKIDPLNEGKDILQWFFPHISYIVWNLILEGDLVLKVFLKIQVNDHTIKISLIFANNPLATQEL